MPVRAFLAELAELSPASRERERAAIVSFAKWAVRQELLQANPMDRIDIAKVPRSLPCSGRGRRRRQGARRGHASVRLPTAPAGFRWLERTGWFVIAVANGQVRQSRPRALASAVAVEAITLSSCTVLSVLRLVNTERIIGALDPGDQTIARSLAVP